MCLSGLVERMVHSYGNLSATVCSMQDDARTQAPEIALFGEILRLAFITQYNDQQNNKNNTDQTKTAKHEMNWRIVNIFHRIRRIT